MRYLITLVLAAALISAAPVTTRVARPTALPAACEAIAALQASLVAGHPVEPPHVLRISVVGNFAYATYRWGEGGGPALLQHDTTGWHVISAGHGDAMSADILVAFGAPPGSVAQLLNLQPPPPCTPIRVNTPPPPPPTRRPSPKPTQRIGNPNAPEDRSYAKLLSPEGIVIQGSCAAARLANGEDPSSEVAFLGHIKDSAREILRQYPNDKYMHRQLFVLEIAYGKAKSAGHSGMIEMHTLLLTHYPQSYEARESLDAAAAWPTNRSPLIRCNLRAQDRPTAPPH